MSSSRVTPNQFFTVWIHNNFKQKKPSYLIDKFYEKSFKYLWHNRSGKETVIFDFFSFLHLPIILWIRNRRNKFGCPLTRLSIFGFVLGALLLGVVIGATIVAILSQKKSTTSKNTSFLTIKLEIEVFLYTKL